jgi:hypothetical protein
VVIDPDHLERAARSRDRYIDAIHAAIEAQISYEDALRRLLVEASIDEIEVDLGSIPEQIRRKLVAPDRGVCCSFCGTRQLRVRKLIAGPEVYICDGCVEMAQAVSLGGERCTSLGDFVAEEDREAKCSFCGKRPPQVMAMVRLGERRICNECLDLCRDILEEELAEQ